MLVLCLVPTGAVSSTESLQDSNQSSLKLYCAGNHCAGSMSGTGASPCSETPQDSTQHHSTGDNIEKGNMQRYRITEITVLFEICLRYRYAT